MDLRVIVSSKETNLNTDPIKSTLKNGLLIFSKPSNMSRTIKALKLSPSVA